MTTSQFRAISKPPPSAMPLTAASIGFLPFRLARPAEALEGLTCSHGLSEPSCAASISRRSEPYSKWVRRSVTLRFTQLSEFACGVTHTAQKAFVPAPVTIATRNDGSSSNHLQTASSCQLSNRFVVFIFFGLLMVTSMICSAGKETMHSSQCGGRRSMTGRMKTESTVPRDY